MSTIFTILFLTILNSPFSVLKAQPGLDIELLQGPNGFTVEPVDQSFTTLTGFSVANGDLNADGLNDVVLGAPAASPNSTTITGQSYVLFGAESADQAATLDLDNLDGTNGFYLNGIDADDASGWSLAFGDINDDGTSDLIMGAPGASPNGGDSGETYVIFGDSDIGAGGVLGMSALSGQNGFIINGTAADERTGNAVASGDVNGDGVDDVIIGAPNSDTAEDGRIYVVFGGSTVGSSEPLELSSLDGNNGFVITAVATENFLNNLLSTGDFNNDGFDDIVFGSFDADNGPFVVYGSSNLGSGGTFDINSLDGTNGFEVIRSNDTDSNNNFGNAVTSGDINGDGIDDLIIGEPINVVNFVANVGQTYVVFGSPTLGSGGTFDTESLDGTNGFHIFGINSFDLTGWSVATAQINGDGIDDVIISTNNANAFESDLYILFGGAAVGSNGTVQLSDLDGTNGFLIRGIDYNSYAVYGTSLSGGDINGDGIDEIITGIPLLERVHVVSNNVSSQPITGDPGFRMLSAPISGMVFDQLLDPFWTQGFAGSDGPSAPDANVWTWDETLNSNNETPNSGDWVSLANQNTQNLDPATGFLFHIFNDDNFDGTPEGFPKYMFTGAPFFGGSYQISGPVTPVSNLDDGRFFLAGNPYAGTLDWDLTTTSNLSQSVYVYDEATSAWLSWNGSVGELTNGAIAPFQGFFVQGSGGNGMLTIEEDDLSQSDGILYKSEKQLLSIAFELKKEEQTNRTWLHFEETASTGFDKMDGLELQPLTASSLQLFTLNSDDHSLNINALPLDQRLTIPLGMLLQSETDLSESSATLSWKGLQEFPLSWQIELVDTYTNQRIDLRDKNFLEVEVPVMKRMVTNFEAGASPQPKALQFKNKASKARYVLQVTPGTVSEDLAEMPSRINLMQNYPNPFNPATVIRFELPTSQQITLEVFDISGRKIATLLNEVREAGRHEVQWAPEGLASGLYLYKLNTGSQVITKKMMLIK